MLPFEKFEFAICRNPNSEVSTIIIENQTKLMRTSDEQQRNREKHILYRLLSQREDRIAINYFRDLVYNNKHLYRNNYGGGLSEFFRTLVSDDIKNNLIRNNSAPAVQFLAEIDLILQNLDSTTREQNEFERFERTDQMNFVVNNILQKIEDASNDEKKTNELVEYIKNAYSLKRLISLDERPEIISFLIQHPELVTDAFFYNNRSKGVMDFIQVHGEKFKTNPEFIRQVEMAIANNNYSIEIIDKSGRDFSANQKQSRNIYSILANS